MKLRIEIEMDNAAFDDDTGLECARILAAVAGQIRDATNIYEGQGWTLHDFNGNRVGEAKVTR